MSKENVGYRVEEWDNENGRLAKEGPICCARFAGTKTGLYMAYLAAERVAFNAERESIVTVIDESLETPGAEFQPESSVVTRFENRLPSVLVPWPEEFQLQDLFQFQAGIVSRWDFRRFGSAKAPSDHCSSAVTNLLVAVLRVEYPTLSAEALGKVAMAAHTALRAEAAENAGNLWKDL